MNDKWRFGATAIIWALTTLIVMMMIDNAR